MKKDIKNYIKEYTVIYKSRELGYDVYFSKTYNSLKHHIDFINSKDFDNDYCTGYILYEWNFIGVKRYVLDNKLTIKKIQENIDFLITSNKAMLKLLISNKKICKTFNMPSKLKCKDDYIKTYLTILNVFHYNVFNVERFDLWKFND